MKNINNWKYALSQMKIDFLILNPEYLPKDVQEKYKDSANKFLESFADLLKMNKANSDISEKAYLEVYGDKK